MRILVIGSGGREHAICATFKRSKSVTRIFCAPGNAGIAEAAECVALEPSDISGLVEFAASSTVNITFVGGETALALGIVDEFERRGLKIVGPTAAAARLESSKAFAKDFMLRHSIPTARHAAASSPAEAIEILNSGKFGDSEKPVVVKADGLASGKGVVVARNRAEAIAAIESMESLVGSAAEHIVLEECLFGREVSLLMFADGEDFALMPPTRDHKRIGEGDTGPNTGGMGTITDASLLTDEQTREIVETIIKPTLRGCVAEGFPFRGILFLGIMMAGVSSPHVSEGSGAQALPFGRATDTDAVPMLLEYNVRFGDPETQSILVRLETDLVDICEAMLASGSEPRAAGVPARASRSGVEDVTGVFSSHPDLASLNIKWRAGNSACVILAAKGYPQKPRTGDVISGIERAAVHKNVYIFHSGTARVSEPGAAGVDDATGAFAGGNATVMERANSFITAGGRVLGVTTTGDDLREALDRAYAAVKEISWNGMQYRRDIGK